MFSIFILFTIVLVTNNTIQARNLPTDKQKLLIISFDGFRHDYIDRYRLENFTSFLKNDLSSKALYINPQFTTQTFPNHWSIATGSYIENHGIIANSFYDPKYKQYFNRENKNYVDLKWWNSSEPIWFNAAKKGIKSGSYFWPGSDAIFDNTTLFNKIEFDKATTFEHKIDQMIDWFVNDNYSFITIYHQQPDSSSHRYGIDSAEFNRTIKEVDTSFGYLIYMLKKYNLYDSNDFNLIVLSDHGMANVNLNIFLDDYINETDAVIWSESGNLFHFQPLINRDIFLKKLSLVPNSTAMLKEDIPNYYNYKKNNRIGDVLLIADEGVGIIYMKNKKLRNGENPPENYEEKKRAFLAETEKASHGYFNNYKNMKGIFLVRGSKFRKGFNYSNYVENVDVYPLVCYLLDLECEKRNGSFDRVSPFLNTFKSHSQVNIASLKLIILNIIGFFLKLLN